MSNFLKAHVQFNGMKCDIENINEPLIDTCGRR